MCTEPPLVSEVRPKQSADIPGALLAMLPRTTQKDAVPKSFARHLQRERRRDRAFCIGRSPKSIKFSAKAPNELGGLFLHWKRILAAFTPLRDTNSQLGGTQARVVCKVSLM